MNFKGLVKIFTPRFYRRIDISKTAGDYHSLHIKVKQNLVRPCLCKCGKRPVDDLHNISGNYQRNLKDWEWLCRSCHSKLHRPVGYRKNKMTHLDTKKNYLLVKKSK